MILLSFRNVTCLIRSARMGRALNFRIHLLQYLGALENVWEKCNFPARLRIYRVRETQTLDSVLGNLECNVTMTISRATVNPAVLNDAGVTADLQKANRQNQSWRDKRAQQLMGLAAKPRGRGSKFVPQNLRCKRTKLFMKVVFWAPYIHCDVRISTQICTKSET